MKKKTSITLNKQVFLKILLALLFLAICILVLKSQIASNKESAGFMSLKADMSSLLSSFNSIDQGWTYDDFCRSQGGVYQDNIPSWCGAHLINRSEVLSEPELKLEKYSHIIDQSGLFIFIEEVNDTSKGYRYIVYEYKRLPKSNCSLGTNKDSSSNAVSITFGCSHSANKFYFKKDNP